MSAFENPFRPDGPRQDTVMVAGKIAGYVDEAPGGWQAPPRLLLTEPRWFAEEDEARRFVLEAHEFADIVAPAGGAR
ncbi:MAG TPA: hypothetical protein VGW74_08035 [Propionibacteriaceae bacterium]|nr:hypothetical protein [Propionibacteriaceae bacterium]